MFQKKAKSPILRPIKGEFLSVIIRITEIHVDVSFFIGTMKGKVLHVSKLIMFNPLFSNFYDRCNLVDCTFKVG